MQFWEKIALNADFLNFLQMTLASVMKRYKANGASLMSDFHRVSLKMAWLRLCRITNESTEIENCYSSLNRELRWLWNSVMHVKIYFFFCVFQKHLGIQGRLTE